KAQMTNIAAANPDVVLMPIYYGEAGRAITALRAAGCKAKIIGGDGFGSVKNYASAADLEGTIYMSGYAPGTPSVAKYEADYKAKYGEEVPNMFAPLAWDASLIMAEGLKAAEAKGLKAGTAEYKQAVIDAIKGMQAFEGITGSYTFNETNDPIKSVAIIKIAGGAELFDEFF
ncbi:MAG: ABC transporter substrate-binding protein, partial [Spirochaetales bacterium]|nr:ABC transporter substrate-binding protein [Spirochaetales bacterium]